MARSIIELILKASGAAQAQSAVKGLHSSIEGLDSGFAKLGLGLGLTGAVAGVVAFGKASFEAAAQGKTMRGVLTATVGSAKEYADAIKAGQEATRGMVDEATLAESINTQLATGLAKNADEAARLSAAGNILTGVFASSGASVEKFNRFLATGNDVFADNFGLSVDMIRTRRDLIQSTTGLSEQEAKLQAVRELLLESSDKYKDSLSEEAVAQAQLSAAVEDFKGSFGELISGPLTQGISLAAEFTRKLQEGAVAWQGVFAQAADISSIQSASAEVRDLEGQLRKAQEAFKTQSEFGDDTAAITAEIKRLEAAIADATHAQETAVNKSKNLGEVFQLSAAEARAYAADIGLVTEQIQVLTKSQQSIINTFRNLSGSISDFKAVTETLGVATQRSFQRQLQDALELGKQRKAQEEEIRHTVAVAQEDARREQVRQQEEAARESQQAWEQASREAAAEQQRQFSEVAGVARNVIGQAFGALGDLNLPFLKEENVGRQIAEDARRLAAIAAGDFSGEAAQLLSQSNPELFKKVMESEDPAAVAQSILKDFNQGIDNFGLIDKEAAKERIRRILLGTSQTDALVQEITQELIGEGFSQAQVTAAIGQSGITATATDPTVVAEQAQPSGAAAFEGLQAGLLEAAQSSNAMSQLASIFADQIAVTDFNKAGAAIWQRIEVAMFEGAGSAAAVDSFVTRIIDALVGKGAFQHPGQAKP